MFQRKFKKCSIVTTYLHGWSPEKTSVIMKTSNVTYWNSPCPNPSAITSPPIRGLESSPPTTNNAVITADWMPSDWSASTSLTLKNRTFIIILPQLEIYTVYTFLTLIHTVDVLTWCTWKSGPSVSISPATDNLFARMWLSAWFQTGKLCRDRSKVMHSSATVLECEAVNDTRTVLDLMPRLNPGIDRNNN